MKNQKFGSFISIQIARKSATQIATLIVVAIFLSQTFVADVAKAAPVVHGKTSLPSFVRVLSYDELMHLPRAKRVAYIRGLRSMMKALDRVSPKLRASTGDGSPQRSQIALLLELYEASEPEALALSPTGVPVKTGTGMLCSGGYAAVRVFSHTLSPQDATDPGAFVCTVGKRTTDHCGAGLIPVLQNDDGTFVCATRVSFDHLNDHPGDSLKSAARTVHYKPLDQRGSAFKNFTVGYAGAEGFGGVKIQLETAKQMEALRAAPLPLPPSTLAAARAASAARSGGVKAKEPKLASLPPAPATTATVPGRVSTAAGAKNAEDAPSASGTSAASRVAISAAPIDAPATDPTTAAAAVSKTVAAAPPAASGTGAASAVEVANTIIVSPVKPTAATGGVATSDSAPKTDSSSDAGGTSATKVTDPATATDAAAADPAVPATMASCQPESETPKTCNPTEIEKARQKYASDRDDLDCIYAGNISSYVDGKKRAYGCQAPAEFCLGSTSCKSEAGDKMPANYSCSSGEVICNPLVFGLQSDGKSPFCVARGSHATASCDSEAAAVTDAKSPLDQKLPGIRDAWNDFADHLFKLCHSNQIAATLHCAECDIISKRLFALNVAARDVKNCGAAIKYEKANCGDDGACSARPGATAPSTAGPKAAPAKASGPSVSSTDSDVGSKRAAVRGDRGVSSVAPSTSDSVWEKK